MKNANAKSFLHPRTKDGLYLALFWALLVGTATGSFLTVTHLIQWSCQHFR